MVTPRPPWARDGDTESRPGLRMVTPRAARLCAAPASGDTKAVQPLARGSKKTAKTSMDKLDGPVWKIFVKGIYKS